MKRILFFLLACCIATVSFGQARFGLKAGANFANQKVSMNVMGANYSENGDGIVSFHIGGVAEIPLGKHFAFRPELLLSGKGADMAAQEDPGSERYTAKIRPYYLELPLNIVYKHKFPSDLSLFGGAGPSLAYGLFGKADAGGAKEDVFDKDAGGYKRFDVGINVLAGIELANGLTFSVNWTPGLANLIDAEGAEIFPGISISDPKIKNSTFGVSIGYMFGGK